MKKIVSLMLSILLLLTTVIVAIPVAANDVATAPLKATPLTEWTRGENSWQYATSSSVTPLNWIGTQGIKLVPATAHGTNAYEAEYTNSSKVYSQAKFNEQKAAFADGTALMFYVELDAGNTFMPAIYATVGWDIFMTMKSNTKYSYAALGSDTWTTVDAVNCTNDETAAYNYGISFESSFKGYVKVDLSALGCVDKPNWSSSLVIKEIRNYIKGVGGDYGNVVMGPYFLVTADSASTEIEVPEEYLPQPIEATPITNWASVLASGVTASGREMPLSYTIAEGIVVKAASNREVETLNDNRVWINFAESQTLNDILLYIEVEKANVFQMRNGTDWSWLQAGTTYKYAALGDSEWSEGTVTSAGIEFDSAFKGYIKLDRSVNNASTKAFTQLFFCFKRIGTGDGSESDYGTAVVAPMFEITKDSISTKVIVPDEYKTKPIEATPIVNWTSVSSNGLKVTRGEQPLGYTTAEGLVIKASANKEAEDLNVNRTWINFAESQTLNDILLYIEVEKANVFQMRNGTDWSWLQAGTTYKYTALGDSEWSEGTVTSAGIEFDSAFKGYIKLDRSVNNASTKAFTQLFFCFKRIGTGDGSESDYGTVKVAPVFNITKDSNSTEITVPEQYRPNAINVTAITDWYHNNYADFEAAGLNGGTWSTYTSAPLDFTSAIGDSIKLSNNTVYEFDPVSSSKIRTYVTLNKGVDLTVAESIIVYVNIPAANTLLFNFRTDTDGSYVRSMTLKSGGTYYVAAMGDTEWTAKTAVYSGDTSAANQTYTGGIVFDGAFEGYVKLPVASIGCADEPLTSVKRGIASLLNIECKFKGLSDKYGNNAVVGPYFIGTTDSTSTELKLNKLNGDINLDSFADNTDLEILRQYLLGADNDYVTAGGNLNKDIADEIDICDLVYMGKIADDIIFSNKSYYKTSDSGIRGEIRSLSAYVYLPDNIKESSRGGVILGNYALAGNCLNFEIHESGKPRIYSVNGSGQGIDVIFNGDVRTGEYTHLVITVDDVNKTATCYINGELIEERSFANAFDLTVSNLQFTLGGDYRTNNSNYFKGKLGEVALFSSTLSENEVAEIYSASSAADVNNLVALWDIGNTKEAYMIEDESGNGNYLNPYTTFFYNEAEDIDRAYSFAVVGDTQSMASSYSGELGTIYDWILENQQSKNIQHVFGLGDIVDNDTSENQWNIAVNAINKMNGKISYSLVRGNHDSNESMNKYFANEAYMSQIDGFYKEGDVNNVYQKFEIGETKYLFMTLEYLADNAEAGSNPGQSLSPEEQDDIIAWAKGVIDANPDYKVIISTHYYINENGSITEVNDIESEIVAKCPNVFLVLGGHISSDNIVQGTTNTYEANGESYKVTSLLVDPQGSDLSYNGLGMVAMLYFSADGKTMEVEYYSTVRDQYFLRDNQFVISVE